MEPDETPTTDFIRTEQSAAGVMPNPADVTGAAELLATDPDHQTVPVRPPAPLSAHQRDVLARVSGIDEDTLDALAAKYGGHSHADMLTAMASDPELHAVISRAAESIAAKVMAPSPPRPAPGSDEHFATLGELRCARADFAALVDGLRVDFNALPASIDAEHFAALHARCHALETALVFIARKMGCADQLDEHLARHETQRG